MSDEIPKWAKERAAALANGSRSAERPSRENLPSDCDAFPDMHAFARYIAAHEQSPVDPDVIAVGEIINAWHIGAQYHWGTRPPMDHDGFPEALAAYRKHKEAGE